MATKKIKLTPNNLAENLCKYGYVDEQLPACFTGDSFGKHIGDLVGRIEEGEESPVTIPTSISIYKTPTSRRLISIPNPATFAHAVKFMKDNWDEIVKKSESKSSHSPVIRIFYYHGVVELNSPAMMDAKAERSDFISHIKERIGAAVGLRHKLQIDIESFYDSIYTHVSAWALCGKKEAKRIYMQPKSEPKPVDYEFAEDFEKVIRAMNCNETHGIITGPFTSRIFSEFVIANIDKRISERLQSEGIISVFRRYVDDYCFYFRSDEESRQGLRIIESVLREYGFRINQGKIVFEEYPFDLIAPLKERLASAYTSDPEDEKSGFFNVLNAAGQLYVEGEKGAYSYALKFLSEKNALEAISEVDVEAVTSMLINIAIQDARFNKYALKILDENQDVFDIETVESRLNELACYALDNGYEQELLNILYYLHELQLNIDSSILGKILESSNDLSILMALDYLNNRPDLVRYDEGKASIRAKVEHLKQELEDELMTGPRWLLKYECKVHGFSNIGYKSGGENSFFDALRKRHVSFYEAFEKPALWG